MTHKRSSLAILICATALCATSPAFAQNWGFGRHDAGQSAARFVFSQALASAVSLSQVLDMLNAIEPGSQLDTRTVVENGRTIYVVRWQASRGRIIIFRIDAESGQIIGRQG